LVALPEDEAALGILGGDNRYTDSVIALDPMTGKLKWYRQEIKHDVWDYDSAYEAVLFKKDGSDLLVHLNKIRA
jgi:alcohol dehydrogenase (cytochrome c)